MKQIAIILLAVLFTCCSTPKEIQVEKPCTLYVERDWVAHDLMMIKATKRVQNIEKTDGVFKIIIDENYDCSTSIEYLDFMIANKRKYINYGT